MSRSSPLLESPPPRSGAGISVEFTAASPPEWTLDLQRFRDASVYQTWAYGAVSWGESRLEHFRLKQNGELKAVAQVRIIKSPLLLGGIAYVRWGPLFRLDDSSDPDLQVLSETVGALKHEYVVRRRLWLRVIPNVYENDPFGLPVQSVFQVHGFNQPPNVSHYHTMRLDLAPSLEEIRKGFRQRWRNKLKHAEASGFSVRVGTGTDFYRRFHTAYDEMMARKQFATTVSVPEFGRIHQALSESERLSILLCEKDEVLFNALVIARLGDSGIYLLAATSNAGLQADGAFLLQWRAMQFLKEEGCRWYDLGGINPEKNPGVYQFKSGMGGIDTFQLPRFDLCLSRSSSWAVRAAEYATRVLRHRH